MYAVIQEGSKQYRVEANSEIVAPRLDVEAGAEYRNDQVLLVSTEEGVRVGAPVVEGAQVVGTVVRHEKGKKHRGFKYKPKKNYRRRWGFRDHQTRIRIDRIEVG